MSEDNKAAEHEDAKMARPHEEPEFHASAEEGATSSKKRKLDGKAEEANRDEDKEKDDKKRRTEIYNLRSRKIFETKQNPRVPIIRPHRPQPYV